MPTQLQLEMKERYRRKAERHREKAQERFERSDQLTRGIPFGQPILVGHHSEKRHRNAIRKSQDAASKGVEHLREAEKAEWSESFAGRAILGRDPEAIEAMTEKIETMELRRDFAKKINRAYKKAGWEEVENVPGISHPTVRALIRDGMRTLALCPYEKRPFPPYFFQNLSANIRRCRKRRADLKARQELEPLKICAHDYTIELEPIDDRIRVRFSERLSREDYKYMRSRGFRWSRQNQAFQRHCNSAGKLATEEAIAHLFGDDEVSLQ